MSTKWLGYKNVRLASINMDVADIRRRVKAAHVVELANDIRTRGEEPIHAPTVRTSDKRLICGRDRMAALVMLKAKKAWVRLVDCTDAEAQELELAENVYRRNENRAELIAQLVGLKEQQVRAEVELTQRAPGVGGDDPSQRGKGASSDPETRAGQRAIKAEARKRGARDGGITTSAIRKAERAAEKSSAAPMSGELGSAPAAEAGEPALTLDLLGCDDASAKAVAKYARKDQEAIDEADQALRHAQAVLRRLTPCTAFKQLHEQVHRVASLVRSARPEAICPWCKGLPKSDVACGPCAGLGYVTDEMRARAPKELREGPPLVAIDGKFYPYADVRDGKLRPGKNGAPAKAEKKISVTTADGAEADLDAV